MMITPLAGLDQLVLIHPLIRVWSGTIKADRDKDLLSKAIGDVPPNTLVDDARKRVIASATLAPMVNVRKKLERKLVSVGYRFLGGFAVPAAKMQDVLAEIDEGEKAFAAAKTTFEAEFPANTLAWQQEFPQWQALFHNAPTAACAARKCRFAVAMFQMAPPSDPAAATRYADAVSDAVPALLRDIAQHAEELWKTYFQGRPQVTQKQKQRVLQLVEKLAQFQMLDPRIAPSVVNFQALLATLPRTGRLSAVHTSELSSLLITLTQPHLILQHGQAVFATPQGSLTLALDADDDAGEVTEAAAAPEAAEVHEAPLRAIVIAAPTPTPHPEPEDLVFSL